MVYIVNQCLCCFPLIVVFFFFRYIQTQSFVGGQTGNCALLGAPSQRPQENEFLNDFADMSRGARQPFFGVSNQVQHKLGCTAKYNG